MFSATDQLEVLVDHADAVVDRVVGVLYLYLLATNLNFALVRGVEAIEDIHQGALASTILA
jgi:hypothetical protein